MIFCNVWNLRFQVFDFWLKTFLLPALEQHPELVGEVVYYA